MKLNISIDDVSPHPKSSVKVIQRCYEIINFFPEAKFTLFVPVAYWRTTKFGTTTDEPLFLDKYPEFCEFIKNLPTKNFEIGYHGFFHGIPGVSDNDEFQNLSEPQARQKFLEMFEIVKRTNLDKTFKSIFRPPAWRMSPHAIKVAKEVGITTLALSPKDYAMQTYESANFDFPHVVYYNCAPPFDPLQELPEVELVYHACEWDRNYLNENLSSDLINWLKTIKDLNFHFISEIQK